MQENTIFELLQNNPYPGRGIVLGVAPGGGFAAAAYFIMGRSENSRNRVFVQTPGGGVATAPATPALLQDPSLVIYNAVRRFGPHLIVTNGDQTDTIYNALQQGFSFSQGLRTRTFEPDAPSYTPRVSGLLSVQNGGFAYQLSILKSAGGNAASVQRQFFEYPQPLAGKGHFLHTYQTNGDPLPGFSGEPVPIDIPEDAAAFGQNLWEALNAENKISLLVRCIFADGHEQTKIFNKYKQS
jgi:hypothetical protein